MTQNLIPLTKPMQRLNPCKCLGAASALAVAGLLVGCPPEPTPEQACLDSGGTVVTQACHCEGVSDFADTCAVGFCTCSPEFPSFDVSVCDCGEGRCFNGTECVRWPFTRLVDACVDSGGTVATQVCYCEGVSDFYDNCAAGTCTCPPGSVEYELSVCDCGEGQCFDGTECVTREYAMAEDACLDSGGTVVIQVCNCGAGQCFDGTACVPE